MRNDGERQILSLLPKDGRHCNTARFGATRDVVFSCCRRRRAATVRGASPPAWASSAVL